jgi:hypothetical protein
LQYGSDIMPNVGELCYLGMWMNKTMSMSFASRRMCGSMLAAWQVLPVAIEHGVRDIPHAMMLVVRTFVLSKALYACQVKNSDTLQLSPCDQSSLQSELLSTCKHVLVLHCSVAQASLLDELSLQLLQIIWLKACVKFFATACTAYISIRCYGRLCEQMWCCQGIVTRLGVHG